MRTTVLAVVALVLAGAAFAELQNVEVGGQLEIRGRWYHDAFESGYGPAAKPSPHVRIPAAYLGGRAIGQANNDVLSMFRYDTEGNDWAFVEQTTSLHIAADFTDNVKAWVEFYTFDVWGEGFRSNYLTGVDSRGAGNIELLQGYLQVDKLFGQDLSVRIGRQIIQFGKDLNSFLLAGKSSPTQRFAYDGIRVTYKPVEKLTIDAWWTKLADRSPVEEDGDTDFYGIYGNYAMSDAVNLSLYWLYLRDAQKVQDTSFGPFSERIEDIVGIDDYPVTAFHTVGVNLMGKYSGFDYNVNVAYQFGDAGKLGALFTKPWWIGTYGDDDAKYDHWGMDGTLGYTTNTKWKVRPYLAANWFQGDDNRSVSYADWMHPVSSFANASVSFNRLFSDVNYCPVINDNADMSNYWQVGGGVTMAPTDKLTVILRMYNTFADGTFDWPVYEKVPRSAMFPTGRRPTDPAHPYRTVDSDNNLGFSVDTIWKYNWSANLTFFLYYGHLFTGEGLRDGAYVSYYGTMMNGGLNQKDADYVFWWAILKF